jgi:hypothetical protein
MRRATLSLLVAALLGGSAYPASAQTSATLGTTIQVAVASGLTVLAVQDLDFGAVVAGTGMTTVTLASADVGKLSIVGQQNKTVIVTLAPPAQLRNGAATIPYTWGAAYNEIVNNPADARTTVFATTTANFRLRDSSLFQSYGAAYMWVYGSVNVGAVVPGVYTGTFTVTAHY